ncbi:MAG: dihydrodipicolinate synthase family protein [Alphaproteobacteria bacterium]|nr:dihydrodipicolinate synthase family protein [Alphaproteobacteria bacterium]
MARRIDWHGAFPPIVTPFTKDGDFDEPAFRKVIDLHVDDGAQGLIIQGCTGEWFMMDDEERLKILEIGKEQGDTHLARGRKVWLLARTSSMNTRQALAITKAAKRMGYDGHMLLPPPFVQPTERELINHYRVVDQAGLPCMLYNNPEYGQPCDNLKPHIVEKLLEFETSVALKDSTVNLPQGIVTLIAGLRPLWPSGSQMDEDNQLQRLPVPA